MTDSDLEFSDSTPTRKIQPGDVLDVVQRLRSLMSSMETGAYTIYADFTALGDPQIEPHLERTRHTLELATARLANLLVLIEKTPTFLDLRREILVRRKIKRDDDEDEV